MQALASEIVAVRKDLHDVALDVNSMQGRWVMLEGLPESVIKLRVDVGRIKAIIGACTTFLAAVEVGMHFFGGK